MSAFDPVMLAQQIEIIETMLEQSSSIIQTYYEALVTAGLPEDFARELAFNWHDIYWRYAMEAAKK